MVGKYVTQLPDGMLTFHPDQVGLEWAQEHVGTENQLMNIISRWDS